MLSAIGPDGTLSVQGTEGADELSLDQAGGVLVVSVNGGREEFQAADVRRVDASGQAGDDVLAVSASVAAPVSFDGGGGTLDQLRLTGTSGNDIFDLAPTAVSLGGRAVASYTGTVEQVRVVGLAGNDRADAPPAATRGPRFTYEGGDGTDRLVVIPPASPAPPSYQYIVSPGTVQSISGGLLWVDYSDVESAEVFGAHLADRFSVLGTGAGTAVTLYGGDGRDTVAGSFFTGQDPRLNLSSLAGGLTYDGGPLGGDTVEVTDNTGPTPDLSPRSYTVSGDGISLTAGGGTFGRLLFSGVGRAHLGLGPSPDTVRVTPAPATTFTIEADDGAGSPGDRLEIDLGGATNPRRSVSGAYDVYSFDNRAQVLYSGFESSNDIIPPDLVNATYDVAAGALTVTFSEDVSASVDATDLDLVSAATGVKFHPASAAAGPATAVYVFDDLPAGNYDYVIRAANIADAAGNHPLNDLTGGITVAGTVGRHVFYNHSAFDGGDGEANGSDDSAVAPDKAALRPGQTPTFANVTSFDRGINGVMIDIAGLPEWGAVSADDFDFGTAGPPRSVTVRRGAGVSGSDRVTLIWRDYDPASGSAVSQAVANGWLTVTVKPNANTGLSSPDVFSFGNLIGETGDGTGATGWRVNALDLGAVKRALNSAATITSNADPNRDGRVNALDLGILKRNLNQSLALPAVPTPALAGEPVLPPGLFAEGGTTTRRVADEVLP